MKKTTIPSTLNIIDITRANGYCSYSHFLSAPEGHQSHCTVFSLSWVPGITADTVLSQLCLTTNGRYAKDKMVILQQAIWKEGKKPAIVELSNDQEIVLQERGEVPFPNTYCMSLCRTVCASCNPVTMESKTVYTLTAAALRTLQIKPWANKTAAFMPIAIKYWQNCARCDDQRRFVVLVSVLEKQERIMEATAGEAIIRMAKELHWLGATKDDDIYCYIDGYDKPSDLPLEVILQKTTTTKDEGDLLSVGRKLIREHLDGQ